MYFKLTEAYFTVWVMSKFCTCLVECANVLVAKLKFHA